MFFTKIRPLLAAGLAAATMLSLGTAHARIGSVTQTYYPGVPGFAGFIATDDPMANLSNNCGNTSNVNSGGMCVLVDGTGQVAITSNDLVGKNNSAFYWRFYNSGFSDAVTGEMCGGATLAVPDDAAMLIVWTGPEAVALNAARHGRQCPPATTGTITFEFSE